MAAASHRAEDLLPQGVWVGRRAGRAPVPWGEAYNVALAGGVWTAWRKDARGGKLTDPLPEGLWLRIRADYAVLPVPRDLP